MRRYLIIVAALVFILNSCEKDEVGGTATEAMAGEWYVLVDAVDASGGVVYEDVFGLGRIHLDTYNTSSNSSTEMWIDDNKNFWAFKSTINVDLSSMTFSATDAGNEYYDCVVNISGGKILYDATTTPSGSAADSIVFYVGFSDDTYPAAYGYDQYRVSGFRYTGLTGDE